MKSVGANKISLCFGPAESFGDAATIFSWFLAHQKYCTQCQLCICRSDLTTLSPVLLQEQLVVVLLLKRSLFSWLLAINERGGYEDLRGSGRQSVIPSSTGEWSCISQV
jgi:hypothetical protein